LEGQKKGRFERPVGLDRGRRSIKIAPLCIVRFSVAKGRLYATMYYFLAEISSYMAPI
jgi:hypothetical protein